MVAAAIVQAEAEAFEKMCAEIPKEEADKLRAKRAEKLKVSYGYASIRPDLMAKITQGEQEPEKTSKWTMVKYYIAKLVLFFFRKWRTVLLLLVFFVAIIALTQHKTTIEPENNPLIYETIK